MSVNSIRRRMNGEAAVIGFLIPMFLAAAFFEHRMLVNWILTYDCRTGTHAALWFAFIVKYIFIFYLVFKLLYIRLSSNPMDSGNDKP